MLGNFHAAQHARDFFSALLTFQLAQVGVGGTVSRDFTHLVMLVSLSSDLGLMGDTQHLAALA